jgi:hypothetical protein
MNSDVSFVRAYIVPSSPTNQNGNYQRLLHRRQEVCNSAKKPLGTTKLEQTITFIEQLKRNQHRSTTNMNYSTTQITKENNNEKKTLTPQELTYQLNLKLEYLIRTRVIERNRVINRTSILPKAMSVSPTKSKITPRENLNQTTLSYLSKTRQQNVVSSSTTTNTTVIQDDFVDKDSFGDNDEAFEEMVEEENITFLQQQP